MFVTSEAGRSLGLDNLLRRTGFTAFRQRPRLQQALLLAS